MSGHDEIQRLMNDLIGAEEVAKRVAVEKAEANVRFEYRIAQAEDRLFEVREAIRAALAAHPDQEEDEWTGA